jgi:hypothetical protein
MVHTMQDGISPWRQERRTLTSIRKQVEEFLPELVHREHLMRRIAVQVKCLGEQRQVVVRYKENKYGHKTGVLKSRQVQI